MNFLLQESCSRLVNHRTGRDPLQFELVEILDVFCIKPAIHGNEKEFPSPSGESGDEFEAIYDGDDIAGFRPFPFKVVMNKKKYGSVEFVRGFRLQRGDT